MSRPSVPPRTSGLPVTISGTGMADLLRVGVHEPRHLALAGGDVGRRDVAVGPDDREDLRGVAARHALELAVGQPVRVAANAALRAAERQAHQGALERHPHRERGALAQRHARAVAEAALHRPHRQRVLDAVAGERLDLAVVEPDREVHDERAPRLEQPRADLLLEVEQVGGAAELVDRHAVELGVPLGSGRERALGLEDRSPSRRCRAVRPHPGRWHPCRSMPISRGSSLSAGARSMRRESCFAAIMPPISTSAMTPTAPSLAWFWAILRLARREPICQTTQPSTV